MLFYLEYSPHHSQDHSQAIGAYVQKWICVILLGETKSFYKADNCVTKVFAIVSQKEIHLCLAELKMDYSLEVIFVKYFI